VDDESSFGNIDIWYDKDSRKVKMEGMGVADAKLINPALFIIPINSFLLIFNSNVVE
jgi:hypothetical protein